MKTVKGALQVFFVPSLQSQSPLDHACQGIFAQLDLTQADRTLHRQAGMRLQDLLFQQSAHRDHSVTNMGKVCAMHALLGLNAQRRVLLPLNRACPARSALRELTQQSSAPQGPLVRPKLQQMPLHAFPV